MELLEALRTRRSIRKYTKEEIPEENTLFFRLLWLGFGNARNRIVLNTLFDFLRIIITLISEDIKRFYS